MAPAMAIRTAAERLSSRRGMRSVRVHAKGFGALRELRELQSEPAQPQYAETLEYELPLDIVKYPSSLLRQENLYIQHFDHKLSQLARGMFDVMYATEGIGLAAPQVGVNVRLMVYNPKGSPNESTESVLVNPRIVRRSSETCWMEEGCLSFPDIFADVERPRKCSVEAKDLNGEDLRLDLSGLEARVFQHEYDHLDGILFHDRMSPEVYQRVRPQLERLEREAQKRDARA